MPACRLDFRGRGVRLAGWILVAAIALAALVVFGLAPVGSSSAGRVAPGLPHERLVGSPTTLAGLLASGKNRSLLITFWASWCGPCAQEAPALERFSMSPAGQGRLVGVDWSDALSGAKSFIRHYSWTFPNFRDAEGTVGNDYRIADLPTTFVIDPSGHIRAVLRGPQNERSLERALAERS